MRRGRAQPCLSRRARSVITLCQRHKRKKKKAVQNAQFFILFAESDLHTLTQSLRGEVDPGRPYLIIIFFPNGDLFRYLAELLFSYMFGDAFLRMCGFTLSPEQ